MHTTNKSFWKFIWDACNITVMNINSLRLVASICEFNARAYSIMLTYSRALIFIYAPAVDYAVGFLIDSFFNRFNDVQP